MTSLVNNWKPSDFHAVLLRLQERALLCRPNDAISFSLKYLEDEKAYSSSPEYCKIAHSLQYLPYLLKNSREFSSNLCITFIFILKSSKLLRPNNELMISIDELTDALNKYKAHEKWESVSFIDDEVLKMVSGKIIDYNVFVAIFRIFTICYTMTNWVGFYLMTYLNSKGTSSQQINGITVIDLKDLLQYLKRKRNQSRLIVIACDNYNLGEDDLLVWVHLLQSVIELQISSTGGESPMTTTSICQLLLNEKLKLKL